MEGSHAAAPTSPNHPQICRRAAARRVDFQVEAGERICLLGRNGAGKTSLMRIITGEETPNSGEIIRPPELVITRLIQEIPA